jgi:hypothetical protein
MTTTITCCCRGWRFDPAPVIGLWLSADEKGQQQNEIDHIGMTVGCPSAVTVDCANDGGRHR